MNTQTASLERRHKAVLMLCEGAVMIALAEILSLISLFRLPQDGSVDLGMLPIFVFCMRWGFAQSFLVSLAHGILQVFWAMHCLGVGRAFCLTTSLHILFCAWHPYSETSRAVSISVSPPAALCVF